jgi:hypothetical protein
MKPFAARFVLLVLAVLVSLTIAPADARAQFHFQFQTKDIETSVDASEVEVGDRFHVTLQVMSESGRAEAPDLGAHQGFAVSAPSITPSEFRMSINGRSSVKRGISATWTLRADKEGTFTIGPPSATLNGAKVTSNPVRVRVVKKGSLQRMDPWDPFGGTGGPSTLDPWKSFFDREPTKREPPPTDPALALDHDDSVPVFLTASVDKTTAVVGEQVTFVSRIYVDADVEDSDFITEHEATAAQFIRRAIKEDDKNTKQLGFAKVRNRVYRVKELPHSALFPLEAGDLSIGAQEIRYPVRAAYVAAKSEAMRVHVAEPPAKGRPPGYALGDTGQFEMSADVLPREIDQGGAVSVTVDLHGTGNVARQALPLPIQKDVAFMQPEVAEKLTPGDKDRFGAADTFRYVVRIDRDGDVDLGAITLPYWDPDKKAYATARATLGVVHVRKAEAAKAAPAEPNPVVFPDVPPPIDKLDGARALAVKRLTDASWYWAAFFGAPFAFVLVRGGAWAGAKMKKSAKEKAEDPVRIVADKKRDAERCDGDGKALTAATRKYVEAQTIAFAGVNVRSEPAESVAALLTGEGVADEPAKEAAAILGECAALAFRPDDVPADEARALFDRAKALEKKLEKGAKP